MTSARTPLRTTRQRTAVADLLARLDGFRSAQELHEILRSEGAGVGLTTVYRHVQALVDAGQLDVLRHADGEAVYRACASPTHHHHLVCRSCGAGVEVQGPAVETWTSQVAAEHGFTDVEHTLEIFGTCRTCATTRS